MWQQDTAAKRFRNGYDELWVALKSTESVLHWKYNLLQNLIVAPTLWTKKNIEEKWFACWWGLMLKLNRRFKLSCMLNTKMEWLNFKLKCDCDENTYRTEQICANRKYSLHFILIQKKVCPIQFVVSNVRECY